MIKKKAAKKATAKANVKKNLTKVAKNIYTYGNGYRAIKMIDGVSYSKPCKTIREAKNWLNTL
jgi:hypothetical protein